MRGGIALLVPVATACNQIAGLGDLQFAASSTTMSTVAASGGSSGHTGGAAGAPATGGGGGGSDPCAWWNPAWPQRAPITVDSTEALPPGYPVMLALDSAAVFPANTALESLRIARFDAATCWQAVATYSERAGGIDYVWFVLEDGAPAGGLLDNYWVYANNPTPPAPDDPATVFTMWEPFDDPALPGWSKAGTPTVSGGLVELSAGGSIRWLTPYGGGHAVDARMAVGAQVSTQWIATGWQRTNDFQDTEPWLLWISRESSPDVVQCEADIMALALSFVGIQKSLILGETHVYGVERYDDRAVYRYDNAFEDVGPYGGNFGDPLQVRLVAKSGTASFDFVRVRLAVDPAPTVTLGPVENL